MNVFDVKEVILAVNVDINLNQPDDIIIQQFQEKVDWSEISYYQKLSEQFIEKFQDKVNWYWISQCQKLSEQFIEKFQKKIVWELVIYNKKTRISRRSLNHLYKTGQFEIFNILKNKPGLKRYSKEIEKQVRALIIEIKF